MYQLSMQQVVWRNGRKMPKLFSVTFVVGKDVEGILYTTTEDLLLHCCLDKRKYQCDFFQIMDISYKYWCLVYIYFSEDCYYYKPVWIKESTGVKFSRLLIYPIYVDGMAMCRYWSTGSVVIDRVSLYQSS